MTRATRVLSVLPEEIADGIERLQAELKDAGRAAKRTQEELAGFRAAGFAGLGSNHRTLARRLNAHSPDGMRAL